LRAGATPVAPAFLFALVSGRLKTAHVAIAAAFIAAPGHFVPAAQVPMMSALDRIGWRKAKNWAARGRPS